LYASHEPEQKFIKSIFNNEDLIDSFIKSPDKEFYQLPYSYKPTEEGSIHVKRDNFNPDFFIKLKDKKEILVVEIKAEGDGSQKNKAKYRDGKEHFDELNKRLKTNKKDWKYHFYFLSPENYSDFYQAIRDNKYEGWKSALMQELE
jgi:type III restriction enzyme